ncbi:helix-turn-helix transcriptional regulator [Rhizobium sp. PvP099]|uniref:helix-turn-helix domain-containing protein n=1 Tax=unclassified Rhizobium TaxID=2613769 RepID=UPI0032AFC912
MSRGKMNTGGPHPVDIHVGRRVRMRRNEVGMSQSNLAEGLAITFQQVQKYERGTNRISTSKLYEIAIALGTPITYFFEDLDLSDELAGESIANLERQQSYRSSKEGYDVIDAMSKLPRSTRSKILSLLLVLQPGQDGDDSGGTKA